MRYLNRTIIILVVFGLTTVIPATAQTGFEAQKRTFTISGRAGVGGVAMQGLPGNPVTDRSGSYSAIVESGWSGTVTPLKEGFTFEPASKVYHNVNSDRIDDSYVPKILTFTISGNVGIPGVLMLGLPGNVVTDKTGLYSCTVDYGWSGTVKPGKEGYTFGPPELRYTKVINDQTNQNYTAEVLTLTISDVIMVGGNPIPGVRVLASSGQSDITDSQGRFKIKVPYDWSGELKLEKDGFVFNPPSQSFTNVTANIIDGKPEQPQEWRYRGRGWELTRDGRTEQESRAVDRMYDEMMDEGMYGGRSAVASSRSGGRSTSYRTTIAPTADRKVLVVPSAEVAAQDLTEIIEDMKIMSHILDERFKETRRIRGVFTDFGDFFGRDNRQTEATYLQGYGVLFSLEVNFAFSPPPKPQPIEAEKTTEKVDSTWQRARRQMFSPGDSRRSRGSDPSEEYDSQMVEELKRDLITTLKHAANIRGVQADEWIILTVIGGGLQVGGFGGGVMMGGMGGYGGMMGGGYGVSRGSSGYGVGGMGGGMMSGMGGGMMGGMGGGMGAMGGMSLSSTTVLTIRAKKSDIDSFSQGEQDYEKFRRNVQIFTY